MQPHGLAEVEAERPAERILEAERARLVSGDMNVLANIIKITRHDRVYVTGIENGVLAVVGDGGNIDYYGSICEWKQK